MAEKSLVDRLTEACVGGCTCLTKTPDIQFHDEMCTYRLHFEAMMALRSTHEPQADDRYEDDMK